MKQSINHVQGRNFRELSSEGGDLRRCDAVPDPLKEKLIKETAVDVSCCAAFFSVRVCLASLMVCSTQTRTD